MLGRLMSSSGLAAELRVLNFDTNYRYDIDRSSFVKSIVSISNSEKQSIMINESSNRIRTEAACSENC
jgi:hypothetical protein